MEIVSGAKEEYTFIGKPSPPINWRTAKSYAVVGTWTGNQVKVPISNGVPRGTRRLKLDRALFGNNQRLLYVEVNYKPLK